MQVLLAARLLELAGAPEIVGDSERVDGLGSAFSFRRIIDWKISWWRGR